MKLFGVGAQNVRQQRLECKVGNTFIFVWAFFIWCKILKDGTPHHITRYLVLNKSQNALLVLKVYIAKEVLCWCKHSATMVAI